MTHELPKLKLGYFRESIDLVPFTIDQSISLLVPPLVSQGFRGAPGVTNGFDLPALPCERFTEVRLRNALSNKANTRVKSSRFFFKVSSSFIKVSVSPLL